MRFCAFFIALTFGAIIYDPSAASARPQHCVNRYNKCLNKCAARGLSSSCVRNCNTSDDACVARSEPRRPLPLDRGETPPKQPRGKPGEAFVPPVGGGILDRGQRIQSAGSGWSGLTAWWWWRRTGTCADTVKHSNEISGSSPTHASNTQPWRAEPTRNPIVRDLPTAYKCADRNCPRRRGRIILEACCDLGWCEAVAARLHWHEGFQIATFVSSVAIFGSLTRFFP